MGWTGRRQIALSAVMASTALPVAALAQTAPPPRFEQVDSNGVDLVSGRFVFGMTEGSIGTGDGAVSLHRGERNDYGRTDQWSGVLYERTEAGTTLVHVQFGTTSDTFTISGSTYTSTKANGATLTGGGGGGYVYTSADGTSVNFATAGPSLAISGWARAAAWAIPAPARFRCRSRAPMAPPSASTGTFWSAATNMTGN